MVSAAIAERLRGRGALPELLVVAVDGGNSFFVDGRTGRYREMLTRDLIAHVEASYRVIPGRPARGLLGISMGGYAALGIALAQPELFAAVATHSAMLLDRVPTAEQGAGRWQMSAFHAVFGDPIDPGLWSLNDPLALGAHGRCAASTRPLLRLRRRRPLRPRERPPRADRILAERHVPHTFELLPGDHGYAFVRSRLETSLVFLGRALGEGRATGD